MVIINNIIVFFLAFIPLIFSQHFTEFFLFPKSVILNVGCSLFLLFYFLISKKIKIFNFYPFLMLSIYIGIQSIFFSVLENNSIYIYFNFIFFFLFLFNSDINKDKFHKLVNVTAVLIGIYALFQFFGLDPFFHDKDLSDINFLNMLFSFLGNKNYVCEFLTLLFFINIKFNRFIHLNYFYFLIILMLFEKSAVLFIFVFLCFEGINRLKKYIKIKKYKSIFKYVFIITILFVVFFFMFNENVYLNRLTIEGKNSIDQRFFIWETAIHMLKKYFLTGTGIGSFSEVFYYFEYKEVFNFEYNYFCEAMYAHNEIIHNLVELGVPGSLLLFIFIFPLIKRMYQSEYKILLLYLIYQSMLSFPLRLPSIWILLILILKDINLSEYILEFKLKKIYKIVFCYLICLVLIFNIFSLFSDFYLKSSYGNLTLDSKLKILKKADLFNMFSYRIDFERALLFFKDKDYSKSMEYLNKSLEKSKRPYIYFYRGLNHLYLGENKKAIEDLEKFVKFFPVSYKAHYNLYLLYKNIDDKKSKYHLEIYQALISAMN